MGFCKKDFFFNINEDESRNQIVVPKCKSKIKENMCSPLAPNFNSFIMLLFHIKYSTALMT